MTTFNEVYNSIFAKNKKINTVDIKLISNYFVSLCELGIINDKEMLDELVNKASSELKDIIYYDSNDSEELKRMGIDKTSRAIRNVSNTKIYINKNMDAYKKETTFYHVLTHFLQTYVDRDVEQNVGVMKNWKWKILVEAETEYISEKVYCHMHNIEFDSVIKYKSEDLGMLSGGTIKSNLKSYQMYDSILRKILLLLDMSYDEFARINFMGKDANSIFEDKINKMYGEDVNNFLWKSLDIIHSTDYSLYSNLVTKEELEEKYMSFSEIDDDYFDISLINQFNIMQQLDEIMLKLTKGKEDIYKKILNDKFAPFDKKYNYADEENEKII